MIQRIFPDEDEVTQEALFKIGQLVKHRRYGYRGVVAEFDMGCKADQDWYKNNKTQPSQNQPWYHVLVHDATHTTYAAQTSLEADSSCQEINHPMVKKIFTSFQDGLYQR